MALEIDRIGTQRYMQPIGMLARAHVIKDDSYKTEYRWVLDPPFQRGSVWTKSQKVAWIESILMGLGLPTLFINRFPVGGHPTYGFHDIVIDGQQRLRATAEFMTNKFKVRGEYYGDQSEPFKRVWSHTSGMTPVVYCGYETLGECAELYLKLLQAGTAHTSEEIEKAKAFLKECDQ